MKKNKQKIIMMFLSVLLLITLFPFSVFADSFPVLPVGTDPSVTSVSGLKIASNSGTKYTSDYDKVYAFYSGTKIYFVTIELGHYAYGAFNSTSFMETLSLQSGDGVHSQFYFNSTNVGANYRMSDIPVYSSVSDGLDALQSYIDSLNPVIKYPYTFQNGYLFVYDLGQSGAMYSFDLSSKSEEYSNIGSIPFPDTNQCYWFDNSLPEIDETTIPSSYAITIDWFKGSKTNIFGQTQDMVATISGTSTGRYLYVYNPPVHYKWSGSSNPTASEVVNYPVTIDGVSTGDNFYIYDSFARLSDFNQGGKVTGTITGTTGYGSVSTDGAISVVTSEGAIFNQTSGGSTDISGANGGSLAENINGLKETLDNFLSQFVQLLSAPISHIRQLISASQEFLSEFSHFFDWLPSEVSGFVISAFIVMVAIGIFKLFL